MPTNLATAKTNEQMTSELNKFKPIFRFELLFINMITSLYLVSPLNYITTKARSESCTQNIKKKGPILFRRTNSNIKKLDTYTVFGHKAGVVFNVALYILDF